MSKFLVTGGAGFIGSNIVKYILENKKGSVRIIDDLSSGKMKNIEPVIDSIEFVNGSIEDMECVRKAVDGIDYVLHLAAIPSVPRSVEHPRLTNDANITGTLNMLIGARDAGVKRFVFSSSSSIYGDSEVMPKVETMIPNPISPYGIHKLTGEYYCKVFYQLYGLQTVSLRYFNVFGPSQDPNSEYAAVIPKFITMVLNDKSPTIFGDGEQTRDFTYVENVIKANLCAAKADLGDGYGDVFNIACGTRISLNDLVASINTILGKNIAPVHLEPRPGDIKHSLAGVQKAAEKMKYTPDISLEKGIKMTIEWYRKQNG